MTCYLVLAFGVVFSPVIVHTIKYWFRHSIVPNIMAYATAMHSMNRAGAISATNKTIDGRAHTPTQCTRRLCPLAGAEKASKKKCNRVNKAHAHTPAQTKAHGVDDDENDVVHKSQPNANANNGSHKKEILNKYVHTMRNRFVEGALDNNNGIIHYTYSRKWGTLLHMHTSSAG